MVVMLMMLMVMQQVEAFVKALFAIAYTFICYDNLLNYDDRLDQGQRTALEAIVTVADVYIRLQSLFHHGAVFSLQ